MKIFEFKKKVFFTELTILSSFANTIPLSANKLSCISMNSQPCKARPEIDNVNSDNPIFYPFSVKKSKCSGNCNNINDPYAKICVSDVVKDFNVKSFNLISRTNETKNIKWHETCKCECRLDVVVCNDKQHWNKDNCRYECKELIDKGGCDKDFIWNPSNCEFECDKLCDVGEYLDYKNCICKKRLIDKLVEEYDETIDEVEIIDNKNKCNKTNDEEVKIIDNKNNSCIVYIVLFSIFFIINVGIGAYFAYYKYRNRNKKIVSKYYQITIY